MTGWPLWDLRLRVGDLELRPDRDDDLEALAALAADGVHDPSSMPFLEPWTDAPVGGPLERSVLQFGWRQRAEWTPERWRLNLVVRRDGEVLGMQGVDAQRFAVKRAVSTGSWLGRRHQGQGVGTRMRAAALHLAFAGLGAMEAYSGAWPDNGASLAVSRKLGYVTNGRRVEARRDRPEHVVQLVLTREGWYAHRWSEPVEVEGLDACLELFGARA